MTTMRISGVFRMCEGGLQGLGDGSPLGDASPPSPTGVQAVCPRSWSFIVNECL